MTRRSRGRLAAAAGLALITGIARAGVPAVDTCRVVADFGHAALDTFPADWTPRDAAAREVYRVLEEGGLRFVRATAEGTGSQMGKEVAWDLPTHPVLAWRWRPRVFPTGADERASDRNDSALGVYAVFPHGPMTVRAVKYVWSRVAPVGTVASASAGLTRMVVLRSGVPHQTVWVAEAVDIRADYARLFGEDPPPPRGIAVLTDADQTGSRAVGDYAAFRVCPAGEQPR